MKYLKEINEGFLKSKKINKSITIDDVKYCFGDLEDAGFKVYVKSHEKKLYDISVTISKFGSRNIFNELVGTFDIGELKECLLFAIPYLTETFGVNIKYDGVMNTSDDYSDNIIKKYEYKDLKSLLKSKYDIVTLEIKIKA